MKHEKLIRALEQLARDIQQKDEQMAAAVRESGRRSQEDLEALVRAVHRLHNFIAFVPERIKKIAGDLQK